MCWPSMSEMRSWGAATVASRRLKFFNLPSCSLEGAARSVELYAAVKVSR